MKQLLAGIIFMVLLTSVVPAVDAQTGSLSREYQDRATELVNELGFYVTDHYVSDLQEQRENMRGSCIFKKRQRGSVVIDQQKLNRDINQAWREAVRSNRDFQQSKKALLKSLRNFEDFQARMNQGNNRRAFRSLGRAFDDLERAESEFESGRDKITEVANTFYFPHVESANSQECRNFRRGFGDHPNDN